MNSAVVPQVTQGNSVPQHTQSNLVPNVTQGTLVPKVIQDVGEVPLVLYSDVRTPLASLSFLRRSLAMAEMAMIAYNDEAEAQRAARAIGFPEAQLFDNNGAEAYRFQNEHDVVVACRGTQPTDWNDIEADANAVMSVVGSIGKVHSGFHGEVNDLWPMLEELLRDDPRPVWFCGHSLGGAMATICALRCKTNVITSDPQELHTFGSPRVGCRRYVHHAQITHYRWVHNNDIVTRVPPAWWGYRHCGNEIYLDRYGQIRKLTGIGRSGDRWRGFLQGLLKGKFDLLEDHSIKHYARHILTAIQQEDAALATGHQASAAGDLVARSDHQPRWKSTAATLRNPLLHLVDTRDRPGRRRAG